MNKKHYKLSAEFCKLPPWLLIAIAVICGACNSSDQVSFLSKDHLRYKFETGHEIPDTRDSAGWSSFDPNQGVQNLPQSGGFIWLRFDLDVTDSSTDSIYVSSCPLISAIYQNTKILKSFGTDEQKKTNFFSSSNQWPIVNLIPTSSSSATILIKLVSPPTQEQSKGQCKIIAKGPSDNLHRYMMTKQLSMLSTGVVNATFAIISFIFFLLVEMKIALYLSLFCLLAFLQQSGNADIFWFTLGLGHEYKILWQISAIAVNIPFLLFLDQSIPTSRNLSRKAALLSIAWLLISFLGTLIIPDIALSTTVTLGLAIILFQIVAIIANGFYGIKSENSQTRTFGVIVLLFAISSLYTFAGNFFELNINHSYSGSANFIFLLACTIIAIQVYQVNLTKSQEEKNKLLEDFNQKLKNEVDEQTEQLRQRKDELELINRQLEENNQLLKSSYLKMEDIVQNKNTILAKIEKISQSNIKSLQNKIKSLLTNPETNIINGIVTELDQLDQAFIPLKKKYLDDIAVENKRILLLEPDSKQRRIIKMALGGNSISIEIAESIADTLVALKQSEYDILITNQDFLDEIDIIKKIQKSIKIIVMTSVKISSQIKKLIEQNYISNMIFRDETDYRFVTRNLSTTISKIINADYFGLDKYLNWGIEIREFKITSSNDRTSINKKIKSHLIDAGLKGSFINKAELVAEEMMMNAIYDAPVNEYGAPVYNHLPRSESVELKAHEQATLKLAFDGVLLAIAVEDPFGTLERKTVLEYLKNCIDGLYDLNLKRERKGGGGIGLYQILSTADLVVINVKKNIRTEFIAIINAQTPSKQKHEIKSFHYFDA